MCHPKKNRKYHYKSGDYPGPSVAENTEILQIIQPNGQSASLPVSVIGRYRRFIAKNVPKLIEFRDILLTSINMTMRDQPSVFHYMNYRLFLSDYIRLHYLEKGKSYRAFSKRLDIGSPNYFQQVIASQKNMSVAMAERIVAYLAFPKNAAQYFLTLVRLDGTDDPNKRLRYLESLKFWAAKQTKKSVTDESFHSSWVHQVIWSLAHTRNFSLDPTALQRAIRSSVTLEEIKQSIKFLFGKGYLIVDPDTSQVIPKNVQFETDNDLRRFDLQKNHARFLQIAQLRLNDPLLDREFQGLTISIPRHGLLDVKTKLREFIQSLNESLGETIADHEIVIRLQMAAFIVADPER
jgi:uncharacterized protein (TIGR02147 family)